METTNDINWRVSRMVRVLLALNGKSQSDLAHALGVNKSNLSKRFQGRRWTLEDLATMSEWFDVPVSLLLEDPETRFEQEIRQSGWIAESAGLTTISGLV